MSDEVNNLSPDEYQVAHSAVSELVRKYVFASYHAFASYQSLRLEGGVVDTNLALRELSCALRMELAALRNGIMGFVDAVLDKAQSLEQKEGWLADLSSLLGQCTTLSDLHDHWEVSELFLLGPNPFRGLDVISWLRRQICTSSELDVRVAELTHSPPDMTMRNVDEHFWDLVEELIIVGHLPDAAAVLLGHPLFTNKDNRAVAEHVTDLLTSLDAPGHPYAYLTRESSLQDTELIDEVLRPTSSEDGVVASDFIPHSLRVLHEAVSSLGQDGRWSSRLEDFTSTARALASSPVIAREPRCAEALLLLSGDKARLAASVSRIFGQRGTEWMAYSCAMLLYVHPPTTSSDTGNVRKIFASARAALGDHKMMAILETAEGHVGSLIAGAYQNALFGDESTSDEPSEISGYRAGMPVSQDHGSSFRQDLKPVGLSIAAHVAMLLSSSEPAIYTAASPSPEEFLLSLTDALSQADFPPTLLLGYLRACPLQGAAMAAQLVGKLRPISDRTTLELSALVRQQANALKWPLLNEQACVLESSRGMWWLRKSCPLSLNYPDARTGEGMYLPATSPYKDGVALSHTSTLALALSFFLRAQDTARVVALVDMVIWRLLAGVGRTALVATITPTVASTPNATGMSMSDADEEEVNMVQATVLAATAFLPRRGSPLRRGWSTEDYDDGNGPNGNDDMMCDSFAFLNFAATEATAVLSALGSFEDLACQDPSLMGRRPEARFLAGYLRMVAMYHTAKTMLFGSNPATGKENEARMVIDEEATAHTLHIPALDTYMSGLARASGIAHWSIATCILDAASTASSLLLPQEALRGTYVPVRFQLHFVEFCVSLNALYAAYLDKHNADQFDTDTSATATATATDTEGSPAGMTGTALPRALFSCSSVDILADMLISALSDPSVDELTSYATESDVLKLRRGVLRLTRESIIADNATRNIPASGMASSRADPRDTSTSAAAGALRRHMAEEWTRLHHPTNFSEAEMLLSSY